MTSLEKAQKIAWTTYKQLKKQKYYSDKLHAYVRFSELGWSHIIGNRSKTKRSPKDLIHRLSLLPNASHIIESSTVQGERVQAGKHYVYLDKRYGHKIYRAVLLRDVKNEYIFLSIIDISQ